MYNVKILLDSVSPANSRLTTWELTYPRIVHAELMTHRVFSRCSASSRAIPIAKMLKMIKDSPMMPKWWGKNQSGMQAEIELTGDDLEDAQSLWLDARDNAIASVERLMNLGIDHDGNVVGLHKQIANRITEPWMFITVIVSATSFANWFKLRHSKFAQPEIAWLAAEMHKQMKTSVPTILHAGEWHMPLLYDRDELFKEGFTPTGEKKIDGTVRDLRAVSAGRVARVSYLNHNGVRAPMEDQALCFDRLVPNGHWSPLEHVAQSMSADEWNDWAREVTGTGWSQYRRIGLINPMNAGNFVGWLQYRKTFAGESGFDFDWENMNNG